MPDSIHLLCNYYNYALSKCEYQYVMKIDADQIYYTPKLQMICDAYRAVESPRLTMKEVVLFCWVLFCLYFLRRVGLRIPFEKSPCILEKYFSTLLKFIQKYKIHIMLSGVNVLYIKTKLLFLWENK